MEIVGYSERGAMNALFYGIALNRDEKAANAAMNRFLGMAGETETFHNFKLYSEFSLSEFGNPDFVITAENQSGETFVFFIETRVRDKISIQTVLTALIFRHKQVEPQVFCQKSNRLLGQNIGS